LDSEAALITHHLAIERKFVWRELATAISKSAEDIDSNDLGQLVINESPSSPDMENEVIV
jgi:hypothetical protein